MMWTLFTTSLAFAGSGPWTMSPGEHNVYVGADASTFRKVGTPSGTQRLGTRLAGVQVTGVWTAGLTDGVDLELLVPFKTVWATEADGGFCTQERPEPWCDTSAGVSDVGGQLRVRLLDEKAYRPLTLSIRGSARSGLLYSSKRSRLTTLGDGTTDLGLGVALGRTGTLGNVWYRVSGASDYVLRFGVAKIDERKVPADEVHFGVDGMASPVRWFGIGVSFAGFHRLRGLQLSEIDVADANAWVSLAATHLRVGPQAALYSNNGWTLFSTVQLSVFARNTPADMVSVTVGGSKTFRRE